MADIKRGKIDIPSPSQGSEVITPTEFKRLMIYSAVVAGLLAAGKQPTATNANLSYIKDYVDTILDMMG